MRVAARRDRRLARRIVFGGTALSRSSGTTASFADPATAALVVLGIRSTTAPSFSRRLDRLRSFS